MSTTNPQDPQPEPQDPTTNPAPDDPTPTRTFTHDDAVRFQKEAASRRRALREVEADRDQELSDRDVVIDQLKARVETIDREAVEKIAGESFNEPSDVWLLSSLDQMRAEDGTLNPEKIDAELARVVGERPHWAAPSALDVNLHAGPRSAVEEPDSFGRRLKGAARR